MSVLAHHEHAEIFPLIDTNSFDQLRRDIRENGLMEPITLLDGKILDGRNRYRAMCFIDPEFSPETAPKLFKQFDGDDPLAFVISKNLHRRHLNESQRALIAAKVSLNSSRWKGGPKTADIATSMKVSLDSVNRAKRVIRYDPARVPLVEAGVARVGMEYRPRLRISVQDITDAEAAKFQEHCNKIGSTMSDVVLACIQQILTGEIKPALPPKKPPRLGIVESIKRQAVA